MALIYPSCMDMDFTGKKKKKPCLEKTEAIALILFSWSDTTCIGCGTCWTEAMIQRAEWIVRKECWGIQPIPRHHEECGYLVKTLEISHGILDSSYVRRAQWVAM